MAAVDGAADGQHPASTDHQHDNEERQRLPPRTAGSRDAPDAKEGLGQEAQSRRDYHQEHDQHPGLRAARMIFRVTEDPTHHSPSRISFGAKEVGAAHSDGSACVRHADEEERPERAECECEAGDEGAGLVPPAPGGVNGV
ncbi:hypothetical protein LTR53_000267 [Teratosphaeriaceae sp. CCFEE 6253]|nr:hypothetical protein LTR53_000267 [Teratosphaeriaceae sp. CCFEE 6253]